MGVYVLLVVIGVIIGASALYFVIPNQTPSVAEQVKVTIQRIEYVESDYPVLEIELLNDVPEKNLDGIVGIYQGDKQWTSEVTWYYTGQGEAVILCDTINENQSFRITYDEKNPKATYLDRVIEWYEVEVEEMVIGFMESHELTITQMTFAPSTNQTTIYITNSGTSATTVGLVKLNGNTISSEKLVGVPTDYTFAPGATGTITITYDTSGIVAGNKYSVNFFASDGTLVGSYTDTA